MPQRGSSQRAHATAPWTRPSIASILTGLYPSSHGARSVDQLLPDSVATLAGSSEALAFIKVLDPAQGWATRSQQEEFSSFWPKRSQ